MEQHLIRCRLVFFCLRLGVVLLMAVSTGCATGPFRYKVFGRYKYATVELTERTHTVGKPLAVVGGICADSVIFVADTVSIPLVSVPIAIRGAVLGPCPELRDFSGHPVKEVSLSLLTFPLYFPWSFCLSLYFQSYQSPGPPYYEYFYPGLYGKESQLFSDERRTYD